MCEKGYTKALCGSNHSAKQHASEISFPFRRALYTNPQKHGLFPLFGRPISTDIQYIHPIPPMLTWEHNKPGLDWSPLPRWHKGIFKTKVRCDIHIVLMITLGHYCHLTVVLSTQVANNNTINSTSNAYIFLSCILCIIVAVSCYTHR